MNRIDPCPARPDTGPLTLSVPEAAKLLGVSRDLVYDLIARGELPALRLGRRIVLPRRALEDLVATAAEAQPDDRPESAESLRIVSTQARPDLRFGQSSR